MTVPHLPDEGLFPGTLVDPFERSPELAGLADAVIDQWPEFQPIRHAIEDLPLRIEYVWDNKPFDPATDTYRRHTVAKVTKAGPLWRYLAEADLVVQFSRWFWDRYDPEQRQAVIYHELQHIDADTPGKVSLRDHDIEEFYGVARRYGAALPDLARLMKVHGWFQLATSGQIGLVTQEEEADGDDTPTA